MPTILVIDDDPAITSYTTAFLGKLNYKIIPAHCAKDALRYLEQRHPDLILLDIGLPDMDGLQLLQRIKNKESTKKIPIIMLTADTSHKSVLTAKRLKVFDYMIKPIKQEVLTRKIYSAWKLVQLERAMHLVKEDGQIVLERLPGIALFKLEGQITYTTIDRLKLLLTEQFWTSTKSDEFVLDLVPQPEFDTIQIELLGKILKYLSVSKKTIRVLVGQNYPNLLGMGLNPETQLFIVMEDIRKLISKK